MVILKSDITIILGNNVKIMLRSNANGVKVMSKASQYNYIKIVMSWVS
jgi:hypothetical protein